jgi:hypothetical protein
VGESLQDAGIVGALNMKQIVEDFRLPEIPDKFDTPLALKNVAFGKLVLVWHCCLDTFGLTHGNNRCGCR